MVDPINLGIGLPPVGETSSPGPAAVGEPAEAAPPVDPWGEDLAPEVPEAVIRGLLASMGAILATVPGLAEPEIPDHWRFTDTELDGLQGPIARVVNARPKLRAAAAHGDELTIAVQMAGYMGRNYFAGAAVKAAREPEIIPSDWSTTDADLDRQSTRDDAGDPGRRGGSGDGPGWRGDGSDGGVGAGIGPATD